MEAETVKPASDIQTVYQFDAHYTQFSMYIILLWLYVC